MVDFSIIIPIYNAEKSLEKCLDSVNAQTFENYEVILIDDGSTDQSLSICKRYAIQNKRFRVHHQNNAGPSAARNAGLDIAEGKWICFVDSDDCIEASYLQEIWDAAQNYYTDVVFIGYSKVNENGTKEVFLPGEVMETNIKTALALSEHDMFGYTWIKAFRRGSIKEIRFDASLNLFEDEVFTCQVLPYCRRIGVVNKPIYNYNIGDGSSLIGRTHQDYCLKCDKVYQAWKLMLDGCQEKANILAKKANNFVSRCYYYAFERKVNIQSYFSHLRETSFFKEHTDKIKLDNAVRSENYAKLSFEKLKYQLKICISSILHKR